MTNELWAKAWAQETKDLDLSIARVAGRVTKANPNKEDANWWNEQGPLWVEQYIQWRKANKNWKIWKTPQGVKAIELELNPKIADVPVKMVIDRVFEVDGELVIVDLKTSSRRPTSDLQLGFYKVGLEQMLGVKVNLGNYWMSRDAGTGEMIDLSRYTLDMLEYLVSGFDKARQAGIFLPNLSSCSYCGLTEHCTFTKEKQ
jgi:ATP-dependent exoDNAse (exonuclease V) beta subunit